MNILDGFLQRTQREAAEQVQQLVEREQIKERIIEEAERYAQLAADEEEGDSYGDQRLPQFPGVPIGQEEDQLEYFLVLDFLESIGLKFAPTVFRYESQHPDLFVDRARVSERLHLRSYDRTPLLVQLIEEKRRSLVHHD